MGLIYVFRRLIKIITHHGLQFTIRKILTDIVHFYSKQKSSATAVSDNFTDRFSPLYIFAYFSIFRPKDRWIGLDLFWRWKRWPKLSRSSHARKELLLRFLCSTTTPKEFDIFVFSEKRHTKWKQFPMQIVCLKICFLDKRKRGVAHLSEHIWPAKWQNIFFGILNSHNFDFFALND